MKILAKETRRMIWQNLGNVLLFELLYRGICLPVYLRLANRVLRWTLGIAGYSYLTASNFAGFLGCPWTLPALLVVGMIGIFLIFVESCALITAFLGLACQKKLTPFGIFWGGLHGAAHEIGKRNGRLVLVLIFHYGFTNLLPAARCLSHTRPVNFVIQEIAATGWLFWALAAVLLFGAIKTLPVVFAGFECIGNQTDYPVARLKSCERMAGRKMQVAALLTLCNLVTAFIFVAVYLLAVFVIAVLVVLFAERNLAMAILLFVTERIEWGVLFTSSIFLVMVDFGALATMYNYYGNSETGAKVHDMEVSLKDSTVQKRAVILAAVIGTSAFLYIFDVIYHGFARREAIMGKTQITAHRGSSRMAPENTMAAIRTSLEELADYVELDVQMTKDQVVVLGHDATLKRVAGINRTIASMTWEELKELDVGSWFSSEFAGERIPSLEDVLDFCKGKIHLNVEIKNVGPDSLLPEKVVRLIRERGMEEQCVLTSTSLDYLERIKRLAPEVKTGYILSAAYGDFYFEERADFISIRASFVNRQVVELAHEQGMGVHVWTVNAKSEIERMRMIGVDNLITDYPVLAREILYREEATETLVEYLQMVFQ